MLKSHLNMCLGCKTSQLTDALAAKPANSTKHQSQRSIWSSDRCKGSWDCTELQAVRERLMFIVFCFILHVLIFCYNKQVKKQVNDYIIMEGAIQECLPGKGRKKIPQPENWKRAKLKKIRSVLCTNFSTLILTF